MADVTQFRQNEIIKMIYDNELEALSSIKSRVRPSIYNKLLDVLNVDSIEMYNHAKTMNE